MRMPPPLYVIRLRCYCMYTQVLESKIDPVEWKKELERVGPKLKVSIDTSTMNTSIRN